MLNTFCSLYILNFLAGLRPFLKGFDYFRIREYLMTISQILSQSRLDRSWETLLDIGCGEELWGVFVSKKLGFKVTSMDIDHKKLELQKQFAIRLKADSFVPTNADATKMPFLNDSFDVINCFAVVPLIPGDGDSKAMHEIGRILKKSGKAYITVGYAAEYKEQKDTPSTKGFSRVYDEPNLDNRLIKPSGLRLEKRLYFVEPGWKFSKFWYRLPFILKLPFRGLLLPLLSIIFLKEFDPLSGKKIDIDKINGILLVLEK